MADNKATIEQRVMDKIKSKPIAPAVDCAASQAKYVGAILGSSLGRWFPLHAGTIPIPEIRASEQRPFVRLADEILKAKAADPDADTSHLEWDIDRLVYDLYGLTEEERTAIERSLGLIHASDEGEDAALANAMDEVLADERVSRDEVMAILRAPDGS